MKIKYILSVLSLLFVAACAHHRDVRPGADGVHRVIVRAEETDEGSRDALSQANHYCKEYNKNAAILDEGAKYSGSMDESDYKTAKTAAKVAQAAGSAAYVFGGKNERNAGGIVGLGGGIADQAIGKGYTVEMKFKCQ